MQTGNVFIDGEVCQLGGYENTLLGYKTRSYKMCKEHLDHVDVILFGECACIVLYVCAPVVGGASHS